MKVAISIADEIDAKATRLAKRWGTSRSGAFARVIREYDEGPEVDPLTEAANRYADEMTDEMRTEQDAFLRAGAETVLRQTKW